MSFFIRHSFYLASFLFLQTKHPQRLPMVVRLQLSFPLNVWWTDVLVWQRFVRRVRWVCRLVLTYLSGVCFFDSLLHLQSKGEVGWMSAFGRYEIWASSKMHHVPWRDSCSRAIYSVFAARLILWAQAAFCYFTHTKTHLLKWMSEPWVLACTLISSMNIKWHTQKKTRAEPFYFATRSIRSKGPS